MLKSVLNTLVKQSSRRVIKDPASKKAWLQESTLADHRSTGFNPKRARYKSTKGLTILNRDL